jgi:hypothetical protein
MRSDGSVSFDDTPNGVSGTWKLNRRPHKESGLVIYIMVDNVAATINAIVANGGKIADPMCKELLLNLQPNSVIYREIFLALGRNNFLHK